MIFFAVGYYKEFKNKSDLFYWGFLFILLIVPLCINWLSIRSTTNRASTEFIFNDLFLRNRLEGVANPITRYFIFLSFWADRFLKYLGLDFVFINGLPASAAYSAPQFGLLNLIELPIFILGFLKLVGGKDIRNRNLWLGWIILGALVVSLTQGELNLVRYLVVIIPLTVIVAYGFIWINEKFKKVSLYFCLILVFINFIFFYKYYINLFSFHLSENWQYGYKQIALYIKNNESKYERIVIDPRFGVANNNFSGVPNLYLLYFNEMNPQTFLDTKKVENGALRFSNKYYVRDVDWTKEEINESTLYVVSVHSNPLPKQESQVREIYSFNILDGSKAFKIYESF